MCLSNIYEAIAVYHQESYNDTDISAAEITADMMRLDGLLNRYGKERIFEYLDMLLEEDVGQKE